MTPRAIGTCFGIGDLPGAPGTWASVAAIPLAWALHAAGGFWLLALATAGIVAVGWWATASDHERHFARGYLATDGRDIAWTMIRAAMSSVADTAVHRMQDVLALPSASRMNFPGQGEGWWGWRFEWSQVQPWHAGRLAELARLYGRTAVAR